MLCGNYIKELVKMGCDIHGKVEIRTSEKSTNWFSTLDVGEVLRRNYDLFGFLFGVRNYAGFDPVIGIRPLPNNLSYSTEREIETWSYDAHSHTWISYEELKAIDWDQEAEEFDERIHEFKDGEYFGKCSYTSVLDREDYKKLRNGEEITKEGITYKQGKVNAKDIRCEEWNILEDLVDVLAEHYGKENVRLIFWFDN
jgi:hypothetical protein